MSLVKIAATAAALALLIAGVGLSGSAAVFAGTTVRKLPIYCVETEEKAVALTFDAAWGADKTASLLETLEKYDAKANFFVVGFWAEKYKDELKMRTLIRICRSCPNLRCRSSFRPLATS